MIVITVVVFIAVIVTTVFVGIDEGEKDWIALDITPIVCLQRLRKEVG